MCLVSIYLKKDKVDSNIQIPHSQFKIIKGLNFKSINKLIPDCQTVHDIQNKFCTDGAEHAQVYKTLHI